MVLVLTEPGTSSRHTSHILGTVRLTNRRSRGWVSKQEGSNILERWKEVFRSQQLG